MRMKVFASMWLGKPAMLLLMAVIITASAQSKENGFNVVANYQGGCGNCHGGITQQTGLTLTGPRTVRAGTKADYTFTVARAGQQEAGMVATFLNPAGQTAGTFSDLTGLNGAGTSQVYHNEPLAMANAGTAGAIATFNFSWTAPAAHGNYSFMASGNAVNGNGVSDDGDDWNSIVVQVAVSGATITAPVGGSSICAGATLSIQWTQTALKPLRVEVSNNGFSTVPTVLGTNITAAVGQFEWFIPNNQPAGNNYQVRLVEIESGLVVSTSLPFSITAGPAVLTQPTNQIACVGRTVTFTTGGSGTNLQYRWRKNGVDIPGGTNPILTLNNLTTNDAGTYDCNLIACNVTVATQTATLTVNVPPTITSQPVKQEVCEGQAASFAVDATGSDLTYQWLKDGVPIIGATNKDYRIPSTSLEDAGQYRCRITGSCTPQLQSAEAPLTVNVVPAVSSQPQPANVKVGEQILMFVVTTGQAVQYQWTKNGTDINGATNDTLLIPSAALADSGTYAVKVSNTCGGATSRNAAVKVTPNAGGGVLTLGTSAVNMGDRAVCSKADTVITALLQNT
ncbi:MAG: hypothetical protein EHM43_11215, partial [Ignavibacteriae bacterium]